MKLSLRIAATALLAGSLVTAQAVAAPPGGAGGGGGRPPSVGPPGGMPGVPHMPNVPNTFPSPPVGRATAAPDTDRGRSENKGRTDRAQANRIAGTVASFSGTTLTLNLPTGVTKTFTVDAHAFGQLKPQAGQNVVVQSDAKGNVMAVVPADQSVSGTVVGSTRQAVTLRLPNGQTRTITVASAAASHMNLQPGMQATLVSHDAGETAVPTVETLTGTVVGTTRQSVTLRLPNGQTRTITVASAAASHMKLQPGMQATLVSHDAGETAVPTVETLTGTVVGSTRQSVTLRLPNGQTRTITVASAAASHMHLQPGMQATLVSHDEGETASSVVVHGTGRAKGKARAKHSH